MRLHKVALVAVAIMTAVTAGLASPSGAARVPSLQLSPTSAAAGQTVTASGSGFPSYTPGTLYIGRATSTTFTTSRKGSYSASFVVPAIAEGPVSVTASAGGTTVTTQLTVTATSSSSTTTTAPPTTAPPTTVAPTTTTTVATTTPPPAGQGAAPRQVVATQGPTAPGAHYVMVTWDRSDAKATGYDVLRNGSVVATVAVTGDAWDDLDYTDTAVTGGATYSYQVRARFADGTTSGVSSPSTLVVRSDAQIGSGRIFAVDSYSGTDRQRAQAAVDAAKAAGGGVVEFAARTYTLDGAVQVAQGNNVVLRGAGMNSTFLQPSFAGDSLSCGSGGQLVNFSGRQMALPNRLAAPVAVGDRTVRVNSTSGLAPGQYIELYEPPPVSNANSGQNAAAGVLQDPGTGRDERHRWDANEITAVDAAAGSVTFRYPWSQSYTTAVPWTLIDRGIGNGIERLTIQARSASETTYYSLVVLASQARFSMADVQGRWSNRNYLKTSGHDIRVVGFRGPLGDPAGVSGTCKYKFSVWRTSNFIFVGGQLGDAADDRNQSFITFQRAQRVLVRNSRFERTRTYAFGEHGLGSRHWVFENNYVAGASRSAISLGHSEFGFSGPGIVRNNTFEGNTRDIDMSENSYELRVLDNVMRNTRDRVVSGAGWAGPSTTSDLYGSLRWTIARNTITSGGGDGIVLGQGTSGYFGYVGVKDIVVEDNRIEVLNTAIRLDGDSTATHRFQVRGNTGVPRYVRPPFVLGDHWVGNADGLSYGSAIAVPWSAPFFTP